jgi:uncharacterized protein (TIGR02186 family)
VRRAALLVASVAALLSCQRAGAETLVLSLSSHRVQITSTYTGSELVVFGVIDNERRSMSRGDPYALVVTTIGPPASTVVREKVRFGPIWVNLRQQKFFEVPTTLSVIGSHPLADITTPQLRRRFGIGIDALLDPGGVDQLYDGRFRKALIRLKAEAGLYTENDRGVTFMTPSIFRASIPVPATAPVGPYEVRVSLFSGGVELARETTSFEVGKVGFEQYVAGAAHQHAVLYGCLTAAIALFFGWLASVIFRRD